MDGAGGLKLASYAVICTEYEYMNNIQFVCSVVFKGISGMRVAVVARTRYIYILGTVQYY